MNAALHQRRRSPGWRTRALSVVLFLTMLALLTGCAGPNLPVESVYVDTGIDPETWVRVPAGPFAVGQFNDPAETAADFEIMATPVTVAQFAAYLNDALAARRVSIVDNAVVGYYGGDEFHGYKHEERVDPGDYLHVPLDAPELRLVRNGGRFEAMPEYANHPMTMVSWFAAEAYCAAVEGRLPTQLEWEKAARGEDGRPFPWGDALVRNVANYYNSSDIFEKALGKAGDTTPVGFYSGRTHLGYETVSNASPYGAYDMAGNVWQWTADITEGIHYRFLRGGSKADYGYMLRVWTRNNAGPTYASPNVGFRCVR